jgi:hypothetical protein
MSKDAVPRPCQEAPASQAATKITRAAMATRTHRRMLPDLRRRPGPSGYLTFAMLRDSAW